MKRRKEGQEWYGKISYQEIQEEIEDPVEVEKKIREGTVHTFLNVDQLMTHFKLM